MFSLLAPHFITSLISFMTIKSSYKFMIFFTVGIIFFFFNSSSIFSHRIPPTNTPSPISNFSTLEIIVVPYAHPIAVIGLPRWFSGKESIYQCRRCRFDPWVRRWNDNPLRYSCLGNPMDREAWKATVHGVAKSGWDWGTERALISVYSTLSFAQQTFTEHLLGATCSVRRRECSGQCSGLDYRDSQTPRPNAWRSKAELI